MRDLNCTCCKYHLMEIYEEPCCMCDEKEYDKFEPYENDIDSEGLNERI